MWDWFKNIKINFANFLAIYVVTGCLLFFFYISSNAFPVALLKEISDVKIALITVLTGIMGYYFGSSKKGSTPDQPQKNIYHSTIKTKKKMENLNPEDLWCWNVQDGTDPIEDIGTDEIDTEAENVSGDYNYGFLDTQAVVWRLKRTGETTGTIEMSAQHDSVPYGVTNYVPPTVPTEPAP